MPHLKTYNLFISHAWRYGDEYHRLVGLLDNALYFRYRNYSAPEHKPLFDPRVPVSKKALTGAIYNKISPVNCVLVIGGMYAAHRDWIQTEIEIAQSYSKPIVCVIPRGKERLPRVVTDAAWDCVRWNTDSIVSTIRKHSI